MLQAMATTTAEGRVHWATLGPGPPGLRLMLAHLSRT